MEKKKKLICTKAEESPTRRLFHGEERIMQTRLAQLESFNFKEAAILTAWCLVHGLAY